MTTLEEVLILDMNQALNFAYEEDVKVYYKTGIDYENLPAYSDRFRKLVFFDMAPDVLKYYKELLILNYDLLPESLCDFMLDLSKNVRRNKFVEKGFDDIDFFAIYNGLSSALIRTLVLQRSISDAKIEDAEIQELVNSFCDAEKAYKKIRYTKMFDKDSNEHLNSLLYVVHFINSDRIRLIEKFSKTVQSYILHLVNYSCDAVERGDIKFDEENSDFIGIVSNSTIMMNNLNSYLQLIRNIPDVIFDSLEKKGFKDEVLRKLCLSSLF